MSNAHSAEAPANSVRRLSKPDLDRVVEIDQTIAGRSRRGFFENRVAASLADPAGFISLGYVEGDRLQGYVLAHMLDGEFGGRHPIAVLDAVGVDKAARGHGGAHALLAELQRAARGRGAHAIRTQIGWPDEGMAHFLALAGFRLGTRLVLDRATARLPGELRPGEAESEGQDLSEDRIAVRAMTLADLPAIIGIDKQITGADRSAYFKRKAEDVLRSNGVRMSMLAEIDGTPAGYVMARVDYGEFGHPDSEAVFDTIGVDTEFAGQHVGSVLIAQLLDQLANLRVDRVRTIVEWNDAELIAFLDNLGFRPTQNMTLALAL
ncbi:MAG: GNAT family N-acetyltransferase [Methylobacteriaceae bacterium]|nr:GNAT family N-acetyltransferase [Rhodoblastus sp.]MCC0005030.1 GNAT family N-acetyltransferase [Methylobacteriaceae bacterium]